jgi:YD repeat-containing protein
MSRPLRIEFPGAVYREVAAGNVLTRTDSRGKTTTYTYDALNRLRTATYATGVPTVFEYDGGATPGPNSAGRLTKITDESGSTSYTYDALGRVLTKTQVVGTKTLVLTYTWGSTGSATGSLTSVTYPSGSKVNYGYDLAGRVASVTVNPVNANMGLGVRSCLLPPSPKRLARCPAPCASNSLAPSTT